jgi:hypothetical protein
MSVNDGSTGEIGNGACHGARAIRRRECGELRDFGEVRQAS